MTVRLLTEWNDPDNGRKYRVNNLLTKDANTEAGLVAQKIADTTLTGGTAWAEQPENKTYQPPLGGPLNSGTWTRTPSIFRIRLTGTGTCTLDARDSLGNITAAFATYTATAATDQIEFPFAGSNAVEIRATLTGTITAEVI